jgi:hypothetical protein
MLRRILSEPLVQFLALGGLLFILHGLLTKPGLQASDTRIVITDETISWLTTTWQKQWNRPPTERELQGQIDQYVREEILYREGLTMGLDRDDTIIRRRLAQKVEFLAKDLGGMIEPTEEELQEFYDSNVDQYIVPPLVSFVQIYFSPEKRDNAYAAAANLLSGLRHGRISHNDGVNQGDIFMLPGVYTLQSPLSIAGAFGETFAQQLLDLEPEKWHGPVSSGYGFHIIRISERVDARIPPLDEIREKVLEDLVEERRSQALEDYYQRIREKYEVELVPSDHDTGSAS